MKVIFFIFFYLRNDRNQSPASGQRSDSTLFDQGLFQPDPQLQQLQLEANQEPHQNIQILQTILQSKFNQLFGGKVVCFIPKGVLHT
jgi:hypothetical protein